MTKWEGNSFDEWMVEVDRQLAGQFGGFTSDDLPDHCWWDLWDSDLDPEEAIEDYREYEGF